MCSAERGREIPGVRGSEEMVFRKIVDIISAAADLKYLRLSSSLQDLSINRRIDLEDGELSPGIDTIRGKHPHTLRRESASFSFSKEKATLGKPFARKSWISLLVVLLCLIFLAFLLFVLVQGYQNRGGASKFYVVIDCGSTGNRVYIYEALVNYNRNGNLPLVLRSYSEFRKKPKRQTGRAYDRMETEPGLDKLLHNVSGLKAAVKPLIRWAEKQIPENYHKTTSLFLYATAGVRRLPTSDSSWLLKNVWPILKSSSFVCEKEWVKVISGMEEAYYGWIALNYQAGILGSVPKKATLGSLDLGGSSLQVTFETMNPAEKETNLNLSIGPVNHHLSVYSLSGYGLNDAFDKSVIHLLKNLPNVDAVDLLNGKLEIYHPCLQTGFKAQYMFSKGEKAGATVWLTGAPNWDECSELAKIAVNLSQWSNLRPGIGHFYAISGFFVVYRFFSLTSEATLDNVLQKGHDFCDQTWEVAHKSVPPQPFIEQYCFRAPYVVSLLREGLHITDEQITIGAGSISWTLGVALVEAGKAFSSRSELQVYQLLKIKIAPIHLFAVMLFSSILLLCSLYCIGKWLPTNSGDGRVKMPLSPTAGEQVRSFGTVNRLSGNSIQLSETSLYSGSASVLASFSTWSAHRSQMRLQSRKS